MGTLSITPETALAHLKKGDEVMVKPYSGDSENFTGISMADYEEWEDYEILEMLKEFTRIEFWK